MRMEELLAPGFDKAVVIQRCAARSYRTRGSYTLEFPVVPQNAFRDRVCRAPPLRSCTRTWLASVTIKWLGPTAPWVSGLKTVSSSGTASKLAEGDGDGIPP